MERPPFLSQVTDDDTHDSSGTAIQRDQMVTSDTNTEIESIFSINASETAELISQRARSQSVLPRGLQVPSRGKTITRGFEYPAALAETGVTAKVWEAFNDEIRSYAKLSRKQWLETVRGTTGAILVGGLCVGFLGLAGAYLGVNMRRKRETKNFVAAKKSGTIVECITRWNTEYFSEKGLAVRVDVPGEADDLPSMDLSTSKLALASSPRAEIAEIVAFEANEAEDSSLSDRRTTPSSHSISSTRSGQGSSGKEQSKLDKAERKALKQEERARKQAAQRVRIVLVPYDDSYGLGQAQGTIAKEQAGESSRVMENQGKEGAADNTIEETEPVDNSSQGKKERGSVMRPPPRLQMGQRYL